MASTHDVTCGYLETMEENTKEIRVSAQAGSEPQERIPNGELPKRIPICVRYCYYPRYHYKQAVRTKRSDISVKPLCKSPFGTICCELNRRVPNGMHGGVRGAKPLRLASTLFSSTLSGDFLLQTQFYSGRGTFLLPYHSTLLHRNRTRCNCRNQ